MAGVTAGNFTTEAFTQALAAMNAGDLRALRRVLAAHPQVVHEAVSAREAAILATSPTPVGWAPPGLPWLTRPR